APQAFLASPGPSTSEIVAGIRTGGMRAAAERASSAAGAFGPPGAPSGAITPLPRGASAAPRRRAPSTAQLRRLPDSESSPLRPLLIVGVVLAVAFAGFKMIGRYIHSSQEEVARGQEVIARAKDKEQWQEIQDKSHSEMKAQLVSHEKEAADKLEAG